MLFLKDIKNEELTLTLTLISIPPENFRKPNVF